MQQTRTTATKSVALEAGYGRSAQQRRPLATIYLRAHLCNEFTSRHRRRGQHLSRSPARLPPARRPPRALHHRSVLLLSSARASTRRRRAGHGPPNERQDPTRPVRAIPLRSLLGWRARRRIALLAPQRMCMQALERAIFAAATRP